MEVAVGAVRAVVGLLYSSEKIKKRRRPSREPKPEFAARTEQVSIWYIAVVKKKDWFWMKKVAAGAETLFVLACNSSMTGVMGKSAMTGAIFLALNQPLTRKMQKCGVDIALPGERSSRH